MIWGDLVHIHMMMMTVEDKIETMRPKPGTMRAKLGSSILREHHVDVFPSLGGDESNDEAGGAGERFDSRYGHDEDYDHGRGQIGTMRVEIGTSRAKSWEFHLLGA